MDKELNFKIKSVLETFFMSISVFLFIIASLYIPIIGILFVPIPIALLCLRHNKLTTIFSIIISLIIPSIMFNTILPMIFGFTYAIIGTVLAFCIKKNMNFINTFCLLSLSVIVANVVSLVINIFIIMKSNFWKFAQDTVNNFNESIKIYSNLGLDKSINQYIQSINKIITPQNILNTLPTIIAIFSIIIAFLIYLIIKKILIKNNYKINSAINFTRWYLDPKIGAILIIITCLSMVAYSKKVFIAQYIYTTAYSLLQFFVFIIGLAIINYFLKNKMKFNNKLCIGISIIILISPLSILLPIIGLVDLLSDIRGIDSNSLGTALRKKLSL